MKEFFEKEEIADIRDNFKSLQRRIEGDTHLLLSDIIQNRRDILGEIEKKLNKK